MKKIFSVILMFTFMINIQAATAIKNYDETVDVTKEYINDFELYNDNYIKDTIMNFIENNMYEIDEDYLFLELEKLLEGGIGQYE